MYWEIFDYISFILHTCATIRSHQFTTVIVMRLNRLETYTILKHIEI